MFSYFFSDEERQTSIHEAFNRAKPKTTDSKNDVTNRKQSSDAGKQSPAKRKLVSASDFFGTSAVKQAAKQQTPTPALKRKAVVSNKYPNPP